MKVNCQGSWFGESGYNIHMRGLINGLLDAGIDVGGELDFVPEGWQKQVSERERLAIEKDYRKEGTICVTMPEIAEYKLYQKLPFLIPFCVTETDKLHPNWQRILSHPNVTRIFTPSKFLAMGALDSLDKPVDIIPHGYDPKYFNPFIEPAKDMKTDEFTFLFVGGWSQGEKDRKGLPILLRAFTEEFKADEKIRLIVKLNTSYNLPNFNIIQVMEQLKLKPKEQRAKIVMITQMVNHSEMGKLYKAADVFIMPTKGEAFCMPCIESMACGVPVIATDWGGQTDYVTNKNGWLIKSKEIDAQDPNYFYEGTKWHEPDQEHLQKLLRYAFEHRKEVEAKSKLALKTAKNYTWLNSANKVKKIMEVL